MPTRLCDHLSFCKVDNHCIFLDTLADRYFRLSSTMERAFLAYIDGGEDPEIDVETLIERNILTASAATPTRQHVIAVKSPTRSAIERASRVNQIRFLPFLDMLAALYSTRLQLARRNLNSVLIGLTAYRLKWASWAHDTLTEPEAERLTSVAAAFSHARLYVPVEPRCLLDSIAMVKFLAKQRIHANIVFGVTSDPFSAHAWVQVADLVLNDTVGNASAHTPILVV